MEAKPKKVGKRFKDAITGRWVSAAYAKEHPATTFAQKVKRFFAKLINSKV